MEMKWRELLPKMLRRLSVVESKIYPIGSIYMSVNDVNPSELFGGEWEQIKDRFLLASGNTYVAGNVGGEATHKLTISEMPSHNHSVEYTTNAEDVDWKNYSGFGRGSSYTSDNYFGIDNTVDAFTSYRGRIAYTGGGEAHNNMPPYLAVYVWKRIK